MDEVAAPGRRFIFVIDNLDRLPEAQSVELWANIRSFFLGSTPGSNLPTIILPIDEKAIRRMYRAAHDDDKTAASLAKSFMEKTFDLTFRVTQLAAPRPNDPQTRKMTMATTTEQRGSKFELDPGKAPRR